MTTEEMKANMSMAITRFADELTKEQLDYCVRARPMTVLVFCAEKLTEEQKRYCEKIKKEKLLKDAVKTIKKRYW